MPMLIFKQKSLSVTDDNDNDIKEVMNMIVERAFRTEGL